ncbi:MAG: hypothetical protein NDJ75_07030 [Thermoanaerobaculia bacterium]|nr:hypothetical protein [Thermoanaerobaculia bacterium]
MSETPTAPATGRAVALALLAWVVPGAGHLALRRLGRAALFAAIVFTALVVGSRLEGNLYRPVPGQPLSYLATIGSMGAGAPYFVLRDLAGYRGDATAAGYEYGTAFLLSAGLMNLLLVLDVWDIARNRKP